MSQFTSQSVMQQHKDLAEVYRNRGLDIENSWRSFDEGQRVSILKKCIAPKSLLKNMTDRSKGKGPRIIRELNLEDITEPGSDILLHIIQHRATMSLCEQYKLGVSGDIGDGEFCESMVADNELTVANVPNPQENVLIFSYEGAYGAEGIVYEPLGRLVLEKVYIILNALNLLVAAILEAGLTAEGEKERAPKPDEVFSSAMSNMTINPGQTKLQTSDMLARAIEQRDALTDYLDIIRSEAEVLHYLTAIQYWNRPGFVHDDSGKPMEADKLLGNKFMGFAVFEVVQNAIEATAIWAYIVRVLELLVAVPANDKLGKFSREILKRELSTMVQLEYIRCQDRFKLQVQTGTGNLKYFKRHNEGSDDVVQRTSLKVKPNTLNKKAPQISYMLKLCQPETTPSQAVDWLKKIDDLHNQNDSERDIMLEREWEAFSDLAVIVQFHQAFRTLSVAQKLPEPDLRKGQIFASRAKELAAELHVIKKDVNLATFAAPIANLKRQDMAEGALNSLDEFVEQRTGSSMGFLYEDLVEECASTIDQYCQERKAVLAPKANDEEDWPTIASTSTAILLQQRKEKGKTRPPHSSIFDMTPTAAPIVPADAPKQKIKVKPSTFRTITMFFTRSESVGPIWFEELEAAMKDLKFNEVPIGGSRFNFHPTAETPLPHRSIQFHTPHKGKIEGGIRFRFAYRLRRTFGLELGVLES
ncbi:hypothetical protein BDZ45DRAFT_761244 [Acephala macrosclerotiorum]|nr:hypothetical protein BDZ45DRAFT_761244 [Acephala macrosclerotiorum]